MSDHPAERVLAALEAEPWLITQGAFDQLREVAARQHDFEAAARYRGQNDAPLSFMANPTTAVLDIRGALTRRATFFSDVSGLSSTDALSDEFARLEAEEGVERIVLRLDTPGGQVSGLAEFAERIYSASTRTIAYASDMAASAGYWLGSQADEFIVSPTAIVGSIGVRGRAPDAPREGEMVSRFAPAKLGDRAASQAALDRLEEEFHAAVARGRNVTPERVATEFGQGGIFIGRDAVTADLADRVATFDQILGGLSAEGIPRETRTQRQPESSMSHTEKDGSVSAAEHTAAVNAAREEGRQSGEKAAKDGNAKEVAKAVAAERARISAITEAGATKPAATVQLAIDEGMSVAAAQKIFDTIDASAAPAGMSDLDAEMDGTNPAISGNAPDAAAGDEDDSASIWGTLEGGKK